MNWNCPNYSLFRLGILLFRLSFTFNYNHHQCIDCVQNVMYCCSKLHFWHWHTESRRIEWEFATDVSNNNKPIKRTRNHDVCQHIWMASIKKWCIYVLIVWFVMLGTFEPVILTKWKPSSIIETTIVNIAKPAIIPTIPNICFDPKEFFRIALLS